MPALSRIASIPLRIGELAFAAVVAGIIGSYLHGLSPANRPESRFIYIEVIAGISILLALIWVLPFAGSFFHWPADLLLAFAWFAAFGLLIDYANDNSCQSSVFNWNSITHGGICNTWKAGEAFSLLSACFWLASALLGIWFMSRARKERATAGTPGTAASTDRSRWYRRHIV